MYNFMFIVENVKLKIMFKKKQYKSFRVKGFLM